MTDRMGGMIAFPWPNRDTSKRLGCPCTWVGPRLVSHFKRGCPVIDHHRRAKANARPA